MNLKARKAREIQRRNMRKKSRALWDRKTADWLLGAG